MLNESIAPKQILSENLQYHVHNKLPLTENTFRYGSQSFINLWVGPENYGGFNLTAIFVFWIILESYIRGITVIIYSSGKLHGLTVVSSIEAGLNILLTLFLIHSLGIFGVALATVLSRLISTFYVPYLINKSLKINSIGYVKGLMSDSIFYSILISNA